MPTDPFVTKQKRRNEEKNRCEFCPQLEKLSKKKLRDYFMAFDSRSTIETPTIMAVLSDWGVLVSQTSLHYHRTLRNPRCENTTERLRKKAGMK